MTLQEYVIKDGKKLRLGYTTGSCAIAATKAALIMLNNRKKIDVVEIDTPAGIDLKLEVHDVVIEDNSVSCAIKKDSGDDPDATDGMLIYSKVSKRNDGVVVLDGGDGVGRITREGLFGNVGDPAINPVPKKLLLKLLKSHNKTGLSCTIYAPKGLEISKKTFNKYMGIEGGISIIGTKGIVYPMSEEALLKTIYMEVDMHAKTRGKDIILLTPGNYGENLAKSRNLDIPSVQVSNFLGDALKYVHEVGFKKIMLIGHIGKFAKVSIGIFNTHSSVADTRMEAFVYYLTMMKADRDTILEVNKSITAQKALELCINRGYGNIIEKMEEGCVERIKRYLRDEEADIQVEIYYMSKEDNRC